MLDLSEADLVAGSFHFIRGVFSAESPSRDVDFTSQFPK
jgi:hypothetical protein